MSTPPYFRPLLHSDPHRPPEALGLAGGTPWFTHVEVLSRDAPPRIVPAADLPEADLDCLTAPRAKVAGLSMQGTRLMGIVNITPDSFSDGGESVESVTAIGRALQLAEAGADLIDIGGESTRPGAEPLAVAVEIDRVAPVLAQLSRRAGMVLSLDTRRAPVARVGLQHGVAVINDVSGFTHDPDLAQVCADSTAAVCIMHGPFDPATMQQAPAYDDVLLDVYDFLAERIKALEALGIARDRMIVDPGIGFGKTLEHNLALLRGLALFHGLGCPILLGASRKGFIGTLAQQPDARARVPGSIAVALAGVAQGVQILRVHDVLETRQALTLWQAATGTQA